MVTIELLRPLERGETRIERLELREPSAGSLRGLRLTDLLNADVNSVAKLLPRISTPALTEAEITQLSAADIAQLSNEVMGFFMPSES